MGTVSNVRTKNENTIVIMPYLIVQPIFDCSDCDDNVMLVTWNADMDDRIRIHPLSYIPCIKIRQLTLIRESWEKNPKFGTVTVRVSREKIQSAALHHLYMFLCFGFFSGKHAR